MNHNHHHPSHLLTTPYSGRPSPSRTFSPVDLDDTPPPDTPPSSRLAHAQAAAVVGREEHHFAFPAAAVVSSGRDRVAGYASPNAAASGRSTSSMHPSPAAAAAATTTFTSSNTATGAATTGAPTGTSSGPPPPPDPPDDRDPFLDLRQQFRPAVTTNAATVTAAAAPPPSQQPPAAAAAVAAAAGMSPAAHKVQPEQQQQQPQQQQQQQPTCASTSNNNNNADTLLSASRGKSLHRPPAHPSPAPRKSRSKKTLASHLSSASAASASPLNYPRTSSSSAMSVGSHRSHRSYQSYSARSAASHMSNASHMSSASHMSNVTNATNASSSSKSIAILAVDSNCIAGEFAEVRVTLSDESSEEEEGAGTFGNGYTGGDGDIAFGLDPRNDVNVSQLDDDDDDYDDDDYDDEEGADEGNYRHHAGNYPVDPPTSTMQTEDDYGPTNASTQIRTPLPFGPRRAQQQVVLSESQQRLRARLLQRRRERSMSLDLHGGYGGGGGYGDDGGYGGYAGTNTRPAPPPAAAADFHTSRSHQHQHHQQQQHHSANHNHNHNRVLPRPPSADKSASSLLPRGSIDDVPANISTYPSEETDTDSIVSGVTNFTGGGDHHPHQPHHQYNRRHDGFEVSPSEPVAGQYRSSWMLTPNNRKGLGHPDAPGQKYAVSYLDKPSGFANTTTTTTMTPTPPHPHPTPHPTPPRSTRSLPGDGRRYSTGGAVMKSVVDRMKKSSPMRTGMSSSSSPVPPKPPPPPARARSVSPKPPPPRGGSSARSTSRHRSQRHDDDDDNGHHHPIASDASIVFGAPDTFGAAAGDDTAASEAPTIRDRAKALEGWMGGKGVAIERTVRPTAGYTNDGMYQNAYLRRTSPQVSSSRKTIDGARASLTPPRPPGQKPPAAPYPVSQGGRRASTSAKIGTAPPSFLADAVEAWSNGGGSSPPTPTATTEVMSPRRESSSSSFANNDSNAPAVPPVQEARPYRQASPTKENEPPAKDGGRSGEGSSKQSSRNDAMVKPVMQQKQSDDMMFLKSWSKSRGTTRTEETSLDAAESPAAAAGTPVSHRSHSSAISSPDSFPRVESGSFSDEFGLDPAIHGEQDHSPDEVGWSTPSRRHGEASPSILTGTNRQPIMFDDRDPHGDFVHSSDDAHVEQKSAHSITFDDSRGDGWPAKASGRSGNDNDDDDDRAWGGVASVSSISDFGATVDAGAFGSFDDPFFKSEFTPSSSSPFR